MAVSKSCVHVHNRIPTVQNLVLKKKVGSNNMQYLESPSSRVYI